MNDPHVHSHRHPPAADDPSSGYEPLERAIRELLIEKGVFTAEAIQRRIEAMDSLTPANGARLVARAWTDPAYKARLLEDAAGLLAEEGYELEHSPTVRVVENTGQVHNVIVCTLCSCYPRMVLGLPPAWYKKKAYRARVVREPRAVLAEFGTELPDDVEVRVHDSTADLRYIVLPRRPEGTEDMDEEALAALVTRDALIGTAPARASGES